MNFFYELVLVVPPQEQENSRCDLITYYGPVLASVLRTIHNRYGDTLGTLSRSHIHRAISGKTKCVHGTKYAVYCAKTLSENFQPQTTQHEYVPE